MEASLTIQCGIISLTKRKQQFLNSEYDNLQHFLQTKEDLGLHSANKQQAQRFYKVVKPKHEYPLSIRNDLLRIETSDTKIAEYWAKIPNKGTRQLWVAIKPHRPFPELFKICESKLYRRDGRFYLNVTIKMEVNQIEAFSKVLAVDLGERTIATTVLFHDGEHSSPKFYGRNVRGIRRHYAWLRKRLGEKKLLHKIRSIGHVEQRKVNDVLHKISRSIVEEAKQENAAIVIGELKGIRQSAKGKGKRFNRIVANMPYFRLSLMIRYKALLEGTKVEAVNEKNTSKTCHRCGNIGIRATQAAFACPHCNLNRFNADVNGAINIAKRFSSQVVENGASVNKPITESENSEAFLLVER